jgi:hypothetical protein
MIGRPFGRFLTALRPHRPGRASLARSLRVGHQRVPLSTAWKLRPAL